MTDEVQHGAGEVQQVTDDVQQMSRHIWDELENATTTRTGFTAMQLATVDASLAPKSRTVILRRVDEESRGIRFITDTLSQKVAEIERNPRVALSGYDADRLQQLRLEGTARVVRDDEERRACWNSLNPHSHVLFRSSRAPGSPVRNSDLDNSEVRNGVDGDVSGGGALLDDELVPTRFALIEIRIHVADWLDLSCSPHRRYQVSWNERQPNGGWVAP